MTELFAARLPDVDTDQLLFLKSHTLNSYYRAKVMRYRHTQAKLRALTAALLLANVVNNYSQVNFTQAVITENEYGKPDIAGLPDFHFNLSHSGSWVVCAIDNSPLGVDVQEICQRTDLEIAERFFSAREASALRVIPEHRQRDLFFTLWALKESFIKAEGKGLSLALDSFAFDVAETIGLVANESTQDWRFRLYDLQADYKLALCLEHDRFPKLRDWSEKITNY
ncbi:MAG: 4'-phosphopantetheinyl transferase superfamily protein [Bacillota bacterium]